MSVLVFSSETQKNSLFIGFNGNVNTSRVISCPEVLELGSFYVYIYIYIHIYLLI